MPEIVNVHAAKTQLSALLERVERGEQVVIARRGRPIARLVAEHPPTRSPGRFAGQGHLPDVALFGELSAAELAAWEGNAPSDPLDEVA